MLALSTVHPLGLLPVPLVDKTIFKGGTLSPPPEAPLLAGTSDVFPAADDLLDTLDELSLSSFSLSDWSRLWGFLGLFVAEVDPEDDNGLFLSPLSEEVAGPPLPLPVDVFPINTIVALNTFSLK